LALSQNWRKRAQIGAAAAPEIEQARARMLCQMECKSIRQRAGARAVVGRFAQSEP
jgi:hypothetical protein